MAMRYLIPIVAIVAFLYQTIPQNFDGSKGILVPSTLPNASNRPHTYFGLRTKYPSTPLFGLMWYKQPIYSASDLSIRHTCKQEDNIMYMWKDAYGKSFGHQQITDRELKFEANWVGFDSSFSADARDGIQR
uniref:Mannosyl-oligosaccharide glucosidase n=1 Tax=Panagrellus redivivus TaxID=6233 RepID=A0A7E4VHS6_PANRE